MEPTKLQSETHASEDMESRAKSAEELQVPDPSPDEAEKAISEATRE